MDNGHLKILAIDDKPDNLTTVRAVLGISFPRADVFTALNGPQGIQVAIAQDPDVILLDILMPGMDGYAVCRALKNDERLRSIPVVFLTAQRSDRESRVQALDAGAEGFLSKPIDEIELLAEIRAMAKIRAASKRQQEEQERLAALVAERTQALEQELAERRLAEQRLQEANQRLQHNETVMLKLLRDLQAEIDARQKNEAAVRQEKERAQSYLDIAGVMIIAIEPSQKTVLVNRRTCEVLGYAEGDLLGSNWFDRALPPRVKEIIRMGFCDMLAGQTESWEYVEHPVLTQGGDERLIAWHNTVLRDENGSVTATLSSGEDITERKQAEHVLRASYQQTQLHLERLNVLHHIDSAMTSSNDQRVVVDTILAGITQLRGVDAAALFLQQDAAAAGELAAHAGLPGDVMTALRTAGSDGSVLRACTEKQPIYWSDLQDTPRSAWWDRVRAHYRSSAALPLTIGDQVKGVLQLFGNQPVAFDNDWQDFLHSLALQVAIALDRNEMFSEMERAHTELTAAYEATLEGWSQALELRERETAGHSQRVVELTLALAHEFQFAGERLHHLRRGALLHDIGKMGVPDHILLKPDKLTDEEWVVMRQHPSYAYRLLSNITYLQPSLDIPYCHHEKWDGSGYPRGLAGEQIPLAARLFAVVDVWDALTTNRAYRPAWFPAEARRYVAEQSGKHFDPEMVQAFLKII